MAKNNKKGMSDAQKVGLGVGITAAAAAAAGAYFLYGSKNAPKNRKMVKGWLLKAKGEVLEALEKAGHMTEEEYNQVIDSIGKAYGMMKHVTKGEIEDFKKEMKGHWKNIKKSGVVQKAAKGAAAGAMKEVARQVSKVTKKPAQKSTKKAAKKSGAKKTAKKAAKKSS
jgi:hypothetical protein